MPESKSKAKSRAKRLGFKQSQVTMAEKGKYFIAPRGITSPKAKRAYAKCRNKGGGKGTCAAVSWKLQKKKS